MPTVRQFVRGTLIGLLVILGVACGREAAQREPMQEEAVSEHDGHSSGSGSTPGDVVDVALWERYEISVTDGGYGEDNPHEIAWEATFTHDDSGETLTIPGFYDGNDTFRLLFMPTKTGTWSYMTASPGTLPTFSGQPSFAALDGLSGTVRVGEGPGAGILEAAGDSGVPARKWKYRDGNYIMPVGAQTKAAFEPESPENFKQTLDYLQSHNVHLLLTSFTDQHTCFNDSETHYIFDDYSRHIFQLSNWQLVEERMEALADRNMGLQVMFWDDDAGSPQWDGQTNTEHLMARYFAARLSPYPVLIWNTGIDISEYRSQEDINWLGQRIEEFDAYDHPRTSRAFGGSGTSIMENRTYMSNGDPYVASLSTRNPSRSMVDWWEATAESPDCSSADGLPISFDDVWVENPDDSRGPHRAADLRRAFWKALVLGGAVVTIGPGETGQNCDEDAFSIRINDSTDEPYWKESWDSDEWVKLVNPFIADKLGDTYGNMELDQDLAGGNQIYAGADPSRTKIVYLAVGDDDSHDTGGGGDLTLDLSGESSEDAWEGEWYDSRNDTSSTADDSPFSGGTSHTVTPPSTDDWILLLTMQ